MSQTSIICLRFALLTLLLTACDPKSSPAPTPPAAQPAAPTLSEPSPTTPLAAVQSIIARQLKVPVASIKPESTLASLGADDLDVVEIVMATEEALDITIPDEALGPIQAPPGTLPLPARLTVGAFVGIASEAPKAKFTSPKLDEPHDGTLRLAQVGAYQDLSQLPNPRGYELVFVPELSALEAAAAQKLGQKLTGPERLTLKNKAIVMAMPPADAAKFKEQRSRPAATGVTTAPHAPESVAPATPLK
jgi:acyl carrier protein